MADRYGDRDDARHGGRDYGRYGGREREEGERLERYRQGLDYRGPYDVVSRRTRGGGYDEGREYGEDASGARGYRNDYGRGYEGEEERGPGRDYRRDDDRDSGRDYGRDFGRDYGRDLGRDYGRERYYGGEQARGYGRGYHYDEEGRDYRREDYGRDEERGAGRGAQTDYGRTSSRFFGRGGGAEYEERSTRGYDYGDDDERGRGRRYDYDEDDDDRGAGRGGRGWLDRVSDEVAAWFGDREAVRRRRLDEKRARRHGRGPKNYRRSDERIREDINDRLSDQDYLDASEIEVLVSGGEVTLGGTVETRYDKRLAEDIAESVNGVTHVQNNLRVVYRDARASTRTDETTLVASRPAAAVTGMLGGATGSKTGGTSNTPAPGASNDPTFTQRPAANYDTTADTLPGVTNETSTTGTTTDTTTGTGDTAGGGPSSSGAASGGGR